jgi:hypothetical protein
MAEEQGVVSGLQTQAATIETPVSQQSESVQNAAPAESPKPAQAERTYTQAQVNAIAAKEARKAAEQAETRFRTEMSQSQQPQTAPSVGGMQQMSSEQIQHLIRQEAFNMSLEHQAKQIEHNWLSAMDAERQNDPEFARLYDDLNIENQHGLIIAMQGMDNKAAVVRDLAENPTKYANILMLANSGSPKMAERELVNLSKSLKANAEAKKAPKADAPLSQVKSSNIGGDDGNMSTTDFRNQSWLRG